MPLQTQQTTQQRFLLAPNITLALEVLRMPTMELLAFLERQLEENPCLEVDEAPEDAQISPAESNGYEEPPPQGPDEEWLSHWQTAREWEEPDRDSGGPDRPIEQRMACPQSLHESLQMQLGCQSLSRAERVVGVAIIQRLDEYGYLEDPLDALTSETGAPMKQVEAVLGLIQRLDPPGVGARDLRECLMIQLEQRGSAESLAYTILRDQFPLFAQHRVPSIARATGASLEQTAKACETLKRLNPKPGRAFATDLPPSIVPDLLVHHRERHYDVELHDEHIPRVNVSRAYTRMLRDPGTPPDAKEFLATKMRRANWIIKAIDERKTTVLAIARCLISLQREFLEHGPRALKPLTQAQVAGLVGRHASTVSRAICGKTIDTPYGVFRLEQLFASGVPQPSARGHSKRPSTSSGIPSGTSTHVSDAKIKSEIHRLVDAEDTGHPLSDEALARRLSQRNISVARRTVAKYRTSLKILPAHLRKRRF